MATRKKRGRAKTIRVGVVGLGRGRSFAAAAAHAVAATGEQHLAVAQDVHRGGARGVYPDRRGAGGAAAVSVRPSGARLDAAAAAAAAIPARRATRIDPVAALTAE